MVMNMREPTRDEVRRARVTILRELPELGQLIDEKIASAQLNAAPSDRKGLQDARAAVAQLVKTVCAEFELQDVLDDQELAAAPPKDRAPGWQERN